MNQWPPPWWINVSGIFFILAIVLTVGLAVAVWLLMQQVKSLQAKLEKTIERGEAVVERLESVAKSAQGTMDSIGGSARNVVAKVEGAVSNTLERIEPIAGILMIAMTGFKLYQQFAEMRAKGEKIEKKVEEKVKASR